MPTARTDRGRVHGPARKRFGQHFLERAWAEKVVRAIAPHPDQTFFEIGPGGGAMPTLLPTDARQVFAFEIDRDLAAALQRRQLSNVHVVEGDFLSTARDRLAETVGSSGGNSPTIRVAGNLPYNVASPILF